MTLGQRINILEQVCFDLQQTTSRLEKERIISTIPDEVKEDWQYILEILAGKHKLGYTYDEYCTPHRPQDSMSELTFKQYISPLYEPMRSNNFTQLNCYQAMQQCGYATDFIASIVNRTLRLGIGPSQLPKDGLAPMLAKKFEDIKLKDDVYYVTEKLDGNRCIARYDGSKWLFTSRNGKPLKVNIDMGDLPTDVVYDGELLSPQQTYDSERMYDSIIHGTVIPIYGGQFNSTSGLINSKAKNKQLVYNIFDVMTDDAYYLRRQYLNSLRCTSIETRILPVLARINCNYDNTIANMLDAVTTAGAEGLMLNLAHANYQHKRTADLLKVKNTYTMDMLVKDWEYGTRKYDGMLGALHCEAITDNKRIEAKVGTGISDAQRELWADDPSLIVGKIVEVSYFSMSQNNGTYGTKLYSLRFPRLKRVRYDKEITSID
jgi:DNA ligase-1